MRDPADAPTDDFEIADPVPNAPADEDAEELEEWEDENTDDPVVEEES